MLLCSCGQELCDCDEKSQMICQTCQKKRFTNEQQEGFKKLLVLSGLDELKAEETLKEFGSNSKHTSLEIIPNWILEGLGIPKSIIKGN